MKAILILPFALFGCGGDDDGTQLPLDETAETDLTPDGASGQGIRSRRRMDIDQLSRAITRATGGIGWTAWDGTDRFQLLARTLGKPNYTDLTAEDLTPSLLFEKFLDDAARSVCDGLVAREWAGGAESVLLAHVTVTDTVETAPAAIRENLAALILRFHGRRHDTQAAAIDPWVDLHRDSTLASGDPLGGWRAVCVALIVHPDFYSY